MQTLRWTKRLYAGQEWKRWVIFVAALFAGGIGTLLFHHPVFALIGIGAVLGSTAEFWLPRHFTLDDKEARARSGWSVTALEWSEVKRIVVGEEAVKLSPLAKEGTLSPFRGVLLRFEGNREEVLKFIEERAPKDARFVDYGADGGGDRRADLQASNKDQAAQAGGAGDSVSGDA